MSSISQRLKEKQIERREESKDIIRDRELSRILTVVREIPLIQIKENENQPRKEYDQEKIISLAQSIKEKGLILPIVVKRDGDEFIIVSGHRRYRAFGYLKRDSIPAITNDNIKDEGDLTIFALVENLQRENLNSFEIAESLHELKKHKNIKQEDMTAITGYSKGTISKYIQVYQRVNGDAIKTERFKKLGIEKGYNYFCQSRKNLNDEGRILRGKKLSIRINNEHDGKEIDQAIKRVSTFLSYLEGLKRNIFDKKEEKNDQQ